MRSGGTKSTGVSERSLSTTSQILVGSSIERTVLSNVAGFVGGAGDGVTVSGGVGRAVETVGAVAHAASGTTIASVTNTATTRRTELESTALILAAHPSRNDEAHDLQNACLGCNFAHYARFFATEGRVFFSGHFR